MVSPVAKGFLSSLLALIIAGSFLAPMLLEHITRPWPGVEIHVNLVTEKGRSFVAEDLGLALYAQVWALTPLEKNVVVQVYEGRVIGGLLFIKKSLFEDVLRSWIEFMEEQNVSIMPCLLISLWVYDPTTGSIYKRVPLTTITYDPIVIVQGGKIIAKIKLVVPVMNKSLRLNLFYNKICQKKYSWKVVQVLTTSDLASMLDSSMSVRKGYETYIKTPVLIVQSNGQQDARVRGVITYNGRGLMSFYTYSLLVRGNESYKKLIGGPCLQGRLRFADTIDLKGPGIGYAYILTKPAVIVLREYYYDSCSSVKYKPTGYKQIIYLTQSLALKGMYMVSGIDYFSPASKQNSSQVLCLKHTSTLKVVVPRSPLKEGFLEPNDIVMLNDLAASILGGDNYLVFAPVLSTSEIKVLDENVVMGPLLGFEEGVQGFIENTGETRLRVLYNVVDGVVGGYPCTRGGGVEETGVIILWFTVSP